MSHGHSAAPAAACARAAPPPTPTVACAWLARAAHPPTATTTPAAAATTATPAAAAATTPTTPTTRVLRRRWRRTTQFRRCRGPTTGRDRPKGQRRVRRHRHGPHRRVHSGWGRQEGAVWPPRVRRMRRRSADWRYADADWIAKGAHANEADTRQPWGARVHWQTAGRRRAPAHVRAVWGWKRGGHHVGRDHHRHAVV